MNIQKGCCGKRRSRNGGKLGSYQQNRKLNEEKLGFQIRIERSGSFALEKVVPSTHFYTLLVKSASHGFQKLFHENYLTLCNYNCSRWAGAGDLCVPWPQPAGSFISFSMIAERIRARVHFGYAQGPTFTKLNCVMNRECVAPLRSEFGIVWKVWKLVMLFVRIELYPFLCHLVTLELLHPRTWGSCIRFL